MNEQETNKDRQAKAQQLLEKLFGNGAAPILSSVPSKPPTEFHDFTTAMLTPDLRQLAVWAATLPRQYGVRKSAELFCRAVFAPAIYAAAGLETSERLVKSYLDHLDKVIKKVGEPTEQEIIGYFSGVLYGIRLGQYTAGAAVMQGVPVVFDGRYGNEFATLPSNESDAWIGREKGDMLRYDITDENDAKLGSRTGEKLESPAPAGGPQEEFDVTGSQTFATFGKPVKC